MGSTTTKTKRNLHQTCLKVARDYVKYHIADEDGEPCFDLHGFLASLESRLYGVLEDGDAPTGRFELDAVALARYLWCCVAVEGGDAPDGTTFRGMPILG